MQREADGEAELDGPAWSGAAGVTVLGLLVGDKDTEAFVTMVTETGEQWPHALLGSKAPA